MVSDSTFPNGIRFSKKRINPTECNQESAVTMALNIDNALSDTMERFPGYVAHFTKTDGLWLVHFTGPQSKKILVEVLIRDGGIVMSVLNSKNMDRKEIENLMNTFTGYLEIISE